MNRDMVKRFEQNSKQIAVLSVRPVSRRSSGGYSLANL